MKCPKCQNECIENAKFCANCGEKLYRKCSQCGENNAPENKFCVECGHNMRTSVPAKDTAIDFEKPRSYTPKFLAEKILTSRSSIEGERKLVTVLFADVANYTSMAERLDPDEVHQIMDGCFRVLMEQIHWYEGSINQFTGDGVMALFGAPVAHEDHAQRACYAALAIQDALKGYALSLREKYGIDFKMRIGLNSGTVVVGAIGDDLRMDYTAIGDAANVAARMESLAEPGAIQVAKKTHRMVEDFFRFEPLGDFEVKGKSRRQEAFLLLKPARVKTRIEAAAVRGLTRFVGRRREIENLVEAFETAASGSGQIVGVVGEAGAGKSRILLEFKKRLADADYGYLEGRCLHYGGNMPYLPVIDILKSYLEIEEDDGEPAARKKLEDKLLGLDQSLRGALLPLRQMLSMKIEDEKYLQPTTEQKKIRIFEAVREVFFRESLLRPLVVAFEDLHWIDKSSEEFLNYLIDSMGSARVLLVLLYRPEYVHPWGGKSYYSKIGINQLSEKTSDEMVQAILGSEQASSDLKRLIFDRSGGNPFFAEELTHCLLEQGSVQKSGGMYILNGDPSAIHAPETIQGIIAARIDRVEEHLKRIMQAAAVVGREFAFRILREIMEMQEGLKSQLSHLQGLEFISERRMFPELEYIFKHAFTQEVAYDSLLLQKRKQIHKKIGDQFKRRECAGGLLQPNGTLQMGFRTFFRSCRYA